MGEGATHLNEGEVGYHSLDLTDDLGLRSSIERLELDVEYGLLLGLLLLRLLLGGVVRYAARPNAMP